MNTQLLLDALQRSATAEWMRGTSAGQMVEATHVVAAVLLFGIVLVVDLRLLGLADANRAFTRISRETLPLVWLAFVVSVITGSLMFAASAHTYFANTAFRLKAVALLGAGLNMLLFQRVTGRHVADWDDRRAAPRAARLAGLLSVVLWASVVLLGRWIGFTKGYDFTIPSGLEFGF